MKLLLAAAVVAGVLGAPAPALAQTPVELSVASEVLGRETTSLVWLPAGHAGGPLPVVLFLHDAVAAGESARPAVETLGLAEAADAGGYAIVAPDLGTEAWCATCLWV